jgi:D-amino-acid oxidase
MRITVVGGGVIGLSCALGLAQAGSEVTVVSAGKPSETTSAVAGGLIYPPGTRPADRCARWTAVSLAEFRGLGAPGMRMTPGRLAEPESTPWPAWRSAIGGVVRDGDAFVFTTAIVDTPVYLDWLAARPPMPESASSTGPSNGLMRHGVTRTWS